MKLDTIELVDMQFYGYHGVYSEEQTLGQRFTVDITLYLSLQKAGQTDALDATVNYADVYALTKSIVEGPVKRLLETIAESIAQGLLTRFPVQQVDVRVRKEHPPIPGVMGYAAVQISRSREGDQT